MRSERLMDGLSVKLRARNAIAVYGLEIKDIVLPVRNPEPR
jgi:hypothetical protein